MVLVWSLLPSPHSTFGDFNASETEASNSALLFLTAAKKKKALLEPSRGPMCLLLLCCLSLGVVLWGHGWWGGLTGTLRQECMELKQAVLYPKRAHMTHVQNSLKGDYIESLYV